MSAMPPFCYIQLVGQLMSNHAAMILPLKMLQAYLVYNAQHRNKDPCCHMLRPHNAALSLTCRKL